MFTSILQNITLLITLTVGVQLIAHRIDADAAAYRITTGLLFGLVAVAGMMMPLNFAEGIIYDGRSVVLSLAGIFGGPIPAVIAGLLAASYRLYLGGIGAFVGTAVIVGSALLGIGYFYLRQRGPAWDQIVRLWLFGMVVHLYMLVCQLFLPDGIDIRAIEAVGPLTLLIFPLAFVTIAQVCFAIEKQRKVAKALDDERTFSSQVMQSIGQGLTVADGSGRFRFVNRAYAAMLGYSDPAQLVGEEVMSTATPESREVMVEARDRRQQGEASSYEAQLQHTDGHLVDVLITGVPRETEAGIEGSIAVVTDLTEQKKKMREQTLIRYLTAAMRTAVITEEILATILEQIIEILQIDGAMIQSPTESGECLVVDAASGEWQTLVGQEAPIDQGISGHVWQSKQPFLNNHGTNDAHILAPHLDPHPLSCCLSTACVPIFKDNQSIESRAIESRAIDKQSVTNQVSHLLWFGSRRTLSDEDIRLMQAVADITAGALHRAALFEETQTQASRMAQILENVPQGVLFLDQDGHILLSNQIADHVLRLLGPTESIAESNGESNGRAISQITHLGHLSLKDLQAPPPAGHWHTFDLGSRNFACLMSAVEEKNNEENSSEEKSSEEVDSPELDSPDLNGIERDSIERDSIERDSIERDSIERDSIERDSIERDSGEESHWILILDDITEANQVRAQLQMQERLATIGQLAAGIAHDFNNIMGVIVLHSQMAARSPGLSEKDKKRVTAIHEQAHHATRLIRQILDFSRQSVLQRKPIDLLPLIKEQVKLLKRILPESIRIHLDYGHGTYMVEADPMRIQQTVMNLALNARDAMPNGGRLTIKISRVSIDSEASVPLPTMSVGEWITLSVQDTGAGMDASTLPHIFDPFYTTKSPDLGTGMGLSQVHGIVAQHAGHIDVETALGAGTSFIIYLPSLEHLPSEQMPSLEFEENLRANGETLLLVEDNEPLRAALHETLSYWGYQVLEAAHGKAALETLETTFANGQPVDLILSDLIMPEMGGIALAQEIARHGWTMPFVLMSGVPPVETLESMRGAGVSEWISKPPDMKHLAQVLAAQLQIRQVSN